MRNHKGFGLNWVVRKKRIEVKMAISNLNSIDNKLKEMYSDQVTTSEASAQPFVDRSEVLFAQMNFIALANRERLNLL